MRVWAYTFCLTEYILGREKLALTHLLAFFLLLTMTVHS